jgi:hypothetical protein
VRKRVKEQVMEAQSQEMARRAFLKTAGAAGLAFTAGTKAVMGQTAPPNPGVPIRPRAQRVQQIASCSYAVRQLFKVRWFGGGPASDEATRARYAREEEEGNQLKKKYGEITMLTFPEFTKKTYPGVISMDLWDQLFGDSEDDSQFLKRDGGRGGFDPSAPSSKRYLDQLANNIAKAGVYARHISNNAPRNLCDEPEAARREGIRVAKIWMDAAKQIGARSMRANTGGPSAIPPAKQVVGTMGGHYQNYDVLPYIERCIHSFRELAEYGEKVGVKITIENHWGISSNPAIVAIIINEVNSPYCETTPDFCNWDLEYLCYYGLELLMPYCTSMVHGKRKVVYPKVDIKRCVQVLNAAHYHGNIAVEYELGGDPVQGTITLMNDIVDALI